MPGDPEQLIAAGLADDYTDAISAIVDAHVTDEVLASRLAEIVQEARSRREASGAQANGEITSRSSSHGHHLLDSAGVVKPWTFTPPVRRCPCCSGPHRVGADFCERCGHAFGAGLQMPGIPARVHTSEMPPLNGQWVVCQEGLSGQQPRSRHETRLGFPLNDPARLVVIKRVAPTADRDTGQLRRMASRFKTEMLRQRSVSSRYVAPVVDSGFASGFGFFIITECYNGTMADRIKAQHTGEPTWWVPTLGWALTRIEEVLRGLIDCFEQSGIVHLDIKPSNIALDHNDQARLIDFGTAMPTTPALTGDAVPLPGFTPFYAPAEQMRQLPEPGWCTPACDLRAVGATLYEIVTGAPPLYSAAKESNLLDHQGRLTRDGYGFLVRWMNSDRVIPPSSIAPQLPEGVSELIMKWLDPNPLIRGTLPNALAELTTLRKQIGAKQTWPLGFTPGRGEPVYDESSRPTTTTVRRPRIR